MCHSAIQIFRALALSLLPCAAMPGQGELPSAKDPWSLENSARMGGKYGMLLHHFAADEPDDVDTEPGWLERPEYQSHTELPAGYWVYVRPRWFIFEECRDVPLPRRSWGPEQAAGPPDTKGHRDDSNAWAAKLENRAVDEWLLADFGAPIKATAVVIHESFNAGAVAKVAILRPDGSELEVWAAEQVAAVDGRRELTVELPLGFRVNRVRVTLACGAVPGWNEIDAIGLIDDKGACHWAVHAAASTTYAPPRERGLRAQVAAGEAAPPRGRMLVPVEVQAAPQQGGQRELLINWNPIPVPAGGGQAAADAASAEEVEALQVRVAQLEALVEQQRAAIAELQRQLKALAATQKKRNLDPAR